MLSVHDQCYLMRFFRGWRGNGGRRDGVGEGRSGPGREVGLVAVLSPFAQCGQRLE